MERGLPFKNAKLFCLIRWWQHLDCLSVLYLAVPQVRLPFLFGFFSFLPSRSPLPSFSGWIKLMRPWLKRAESQSSLMG